MEGEASITTYPRNIGKTTYKKIGEMDMERKRA